MLKGIVNILNNFAASTMFMHRGKSRTLTHNLKIASLLSFVAGMVNVTGMFAVQRLTTNVTGHFAFFAEAVSKENFGMAWVYLLYIMAFFTGAFFSSLLVEAMLRVNARYTYILPISIEICILIIVALLPAHVILKYADAVACSLLFAMGLQNALVTSLSNAVVRTTHLTGLFTDLGIEVSQLFFYKKSGQQKKLTSSIRLRLTIILFFFLGCTAGGTVYFIYGIYSLLLAALLLIAGLVYDYIKFSVVRLKRRFFG